MRTFVALVYATITRSLFVSHVARSYSVHRADASITKHLCKTMDFAPGDDVRLAISQSESLVLMLGEKVVAVMPALFSGSVVTLSFVFAPEQIPCSPRFMKTCTEMYMLRKNLTLISDLPLDHAVKFGFTQL